MNLNATLFAQLVVFFILAWFTMKFVWPPIMKALDDRANKIRDGLAAAHHHAGHQQRRLRGERGGDRVHAELSSTNR